MPETDVLIVCCACPEAKNAQLLADTLVGERLAACVNLLPGIVSTYRWQGAVQRDSETLLLIKTTRSRFEALRDRLVALHPYELPEVIAVEIAAGLERYLAWIKHETGAAE